MDPERRFKLVYFTLLFTWDACDQTASWWFWQYTAAVGASRAVQLTALTSAASGTAVLVAAFVAGVLAETAHLVDSKLPEFVYSLGAGLADIVMLVAVFAFEMEGLNAASWIRVVNLLTTVIDFALKVAQTAWAFCGAAAPVLVAPHKLGAKSSAQRHHRLDEQAGFGALVPWSERWSAME